MAAAQARIEAAAAAANAAKVAALTDRAVGLTVNVGTCTGGIQRNQVPDCASAELDVRFRRPEDDQRVRDALNHLCTNVGEGVPGTSAEAIYLRGRPAWRGGPRTKALHSHWQEAALALGMEVPDAVSTGGGSDANLIAATGTPCIDGLGAIGGGYHTVNEWVVEASLEGRARLAAAAFSRWCKR